MPKIERIRRRHLLKKKQQKRTLQQIEDTLGAPVKNLDEKAQFEEGILDEGSRVLLLDGHILFFELDGRIFPTLRAVLMGAIDIPTITVDMGAVKFVINGADIMRPGVTKIGDNIRESSVVAIVDERHGKPLAIGVSKMSSEDMRAATSGKVVHSKHYIGDPLWEFSKS